MNKTERQLAVTLELQRNKVVRAEDLAAHFETSVRTIYRDIQALSEAGVPIIGAPGQGYSMMEGYFLPPIGFTAEEAVALLMGTDFIEQRLDEEYGSKANTARRKIEAILPEAVRAESKRVRETMKLIYSGEPSTGQKVKDYLALARQAILERRKLIFTYQKKMPEPDGSRQSSREVDPYGLALVQGHWVLVARCSLRQDIRHFRLSRMTELAVSEERYSMPPGFDLSRYRPPDDRNVRVSIRANPAIADKIEETVPFYLEEMETREDVLMVTFLVRRPEELLPHVLGWGGEVEVLEPESLRSRIREEAEKMLKRY
ncbi:helix-turn-helix transcriptional regulator [Cohnella thailandensis]|uniref:YafY family transcriptional regulator n=1 Tax=Cohnella thailandensis TaxID=557557 RepID=A0A841T027_9BACL|nr:YafY family protein [Cohnella thailandensis]MBB6637504.1 YafY family transcriptional regulator [Cohnella thailandensis]MBP1977537.1 putative DNA-binding transcriptional regulator YafY [Cohnella thailandensis]